MWLERISGGDIGLIDLDDAKAHLRLLESDFDNEVNRAISAATAFLDVDDDGFGGMGFPLIAQQWRVRSSGFDASVLRMPFSHVTSVDEISFFSANGSQELMPPSAYMVVKRNRHRVVTLVSGESWPPVADRPDAVTLVFTAGFSSRESLPEDIKAAARLLVGHFFENRNAVTTGKIPQELQLGVKNLTSRYRSFAM